MLNETVPLKDPSSGGEIGPRVQASSPNLQRLTSEEIKVYKDCALSSYYKTGLPFASFFHVVHYLRNPGTPLIPKSFNRRVFMFCGNVLLGSLFYSPVCYSKLLAKHAEIEKRKKEYSSQNLSPSEENPSSRVEDFNATDLSYPSDLVSSFNEPESSFSSDFSSFIPMHDEKEDKKVPATTYQDLRTRHRSGSLSKEPSSPLNIEQEKGPSKLSPPFETPIFSEPLSRRMSKKNKYGDEME